MILLDSLKTSHDAIGGGVVIDKASFTSPLGRWWHLYRARLQVPNAEAGALSIVTGPEPVDSAVPPYGWINDVGARQDVAHTIRVDPTNNYGLTYTETRPRLAIPPATTFWVVFQPDVTFSLPQWFLRLDYIETENPLTNW